MSKEEKRLSEYYAGLATELSECRQETRNNETLSIQILAVAGAFMAFVYGAFFSEKNMIDEGLKTNFLILDVMIECAASYYIVILGIRNVFLYHFSRDLEERMAEYENEHGKKEVVRWTSLMSPIVTRNIKHVKTRFGFSYYFAYTFAIMSAIVFAFAVTFYQYMSLGKSEGLYAILRYMVIVYFCVSLIIIVVIFFLCSYRAHDMYNKLTNNKTIELMEKEGIENLTIRKVAEQAKYNSATLYHYFSNLDELELFASVKCLDEYMQETLIHKAEGKDFQEWYLGQWRCFCRHSFQRPRIYNFLFFSPEGTQNLNEVFRRYYEIYPNEKEEKIEDYEGFLKEGDFFKRNEDLLRDVIRERNYEISEQEIKELNEMSVLIYRGMLAIMRSDRDKPTVDEAVDKTVRYLAKTLDAYHLG